MQRWHQQKQVRFILSGPDPVTRVFVDDTVPAAILGAWFSTSNGTYNSTTDEWVFAAPLFVGQSTTLFLNGTIDPAHIEFKFSGTDIFGYDMNSKYDQFTGFSGSA